MEQTFIMARGRRPTAHLPPDRRMNDYSLEHLRKCYEDLCLRYKIDIDRFITQDEMAYINAIQKSFSPIAFNAAHERMKVLGHKVYKIGRSAGAPVDALEMLSDEDEILAMDMGNLPSEFHVKLYDPSPVYDEYIDKVNKLISEKSLIKPEAAKPQGDMSVYALKDELQDVARNLSTALKSYCEGNFSKAFELANQHSDAINDIIEKINQIKTHQPTLVELKKNELPAVSLGVQHKCFPALLKMASAKLRDNHHLNIWVHGPAGTGKSTAAINVAKALELPFYTDGKLQDSFEIKGYRDANGNYNTTQFRQAFENGGVYLADEIDGSMPDALLAFNSALANGLCSFPDKTIQRHPDFIFIAAANTTGTGATLEYVGRFKQDAAFNDRFVFLHWPIDDALETAMCADTAWIAVCRAARARLAASGIKGHLITPRATLYGEALLAAGMSIEEVTEAVIIKGLSIEQKAKLK